MATGHVSELLPDYVLGCLDDPDVTTVAEHLAVCPDCRTELGSYEAVVDLLALGVATEAPPPELKSRLMACIEQRDAAPVVDRRPEPAAVPAGPSNGWLARLFRGGLAWQLAAAVLILVLAASNVWLLQHLNAPVSARQASDFRMVALTATGAAPGSTGLLIASGDSRQGALVVHNLPALDPNRQYQLWLIRDGQRTSGGVFSVDEEGYGSMAVSSTQPLLSYSSFGITVEPVGGSPGPTGEKVLGGSL